MSCAERSPRRWAITHEMRVSRSRSAGAHEGLSFAPSANGPGALALFDDSAEDAKAGAGGGLRVLMQLDRTFILAADGEALLLVDQHAAHERIAYESDRRLGPRPRLERAAARATDSSSSIPNAARCSIERSICLREGGLEIEPFGERTYRIVATPSGYGARPFDLAGFIDDLSDEPKQRDVRERVWASLACHSVTVAGERLERRRDDDPGRAAAERARTRCIVPTGARRWCASARTRSRACSSVSEAPSVLIIAGATASGKTELAIELAREFDAEIVGADSRQIYRGMPIGTAAPSLEQSSKQCRTTS